MQHILVQDEVAIVQWGVKMFFTNDNELYFCHIDIVNGTWEEERVIFELRTRLDGNSIRQYYCWCRVSLRDIFSKPSRTHFCPCSYDATITRALFLIDMNDFNGTNSVTTLNFQYSQFLPLDGAMDTSSQRFFSVLDSDKNLVFFEVNPSM
jgi:hypothetical protein